MIEASIRGIYQLVNVSVFWGSAATLSCIVVITGLNALQVEHRVLNTFTSLDVFNSQEMMLWLESGV